MDPEQIPLRDLHLPEAVGWWPLAPGWWLLIALAVAALFWLLRRALRNWRANRPRRVALRQLKQLRARYAQGGDPSELSRALSQLLRRAMLAYAPRNEVAGLTGNRWLGWLDRGLDDRPFTRGAGRALAALPYRRPDPAQDPVDIDAIADAVRRRLRTPLPELRA